MNDEDFLPLAVPVYSNTLSQQRDGNMSLVPTWAHNNHRGLDGSIVGAVYYGYWRERLNTFCCDQLNPVRPIYRATFSAARSTGWTTTPRGGWFALALPATLALARKLAGEAAYVYGRADATDWHNQPDIRGLREDATGGGVQLKLSSLLPDPIVQRRCRRTLLHTPVMETPFEDKFRAIGPHQAESERYGVFVQGSLAFGGEAVAMASIKDDSNRYSTPPSWTGAYWGLNVGYGTSSSFQDINGANPFGVALAASGYIGREAFSNVDTRGFFGGAQAGYNMQIGRGQHEADLSWRTTAGLPACCPASFVQVPMRPCLRPQTRRSSRWQPCGHAPDISPPRTCCSM
jgi:hypothetical protein